MKPRNTFLAILLLGGMLGLTACASGAPTQPGGFAGVDALTPYNTATSTATLTITPVNAPTQTPKPTITPTTFIYTAKTNDTMWTIAAKNGVSLDAILKANPDVNPYTLSAGTQVVVPPSSGSTSGTPTPISATAVPLVLKEPVCAPSLTGGLYCFALVENNQEYSVQNLTAQFTLTNPETGEQVEAVGSLPLNQLKSKDSLPLFAYFAPPVFAIPRVTLTLLTALPVSSTSTSVLEVSIQNSKIEIASDGNSATVSASLALKDAASTANHLWVAAVAYDAQGNVVGVRQYEKNADLSKGQSTDFTLYVYSISNKIDHVDLFGEAKQQAQ
ncbi:MAG: LysM domain-containing protein [Anaerolineaceae bacterium]|nr:LysM domain-containing protein [Anaerolineaceae bacterium]